MGSEPDSTPKLPLFSLPPLHSPEPPGMLTPLHTSASVPFRWEEEPGKPRPCTTLSTNRPKCLELPPRLLMESKITSPTTVLGGPYVGKKTIFSSSSFRFSSKSPERGAVVLHKKGRGGLLGLKVKGGKKEGCRGSFVFPDSMEVGESDSPRLKLTRNGSFSTLSQSTSHFWTAVYEGFKQVIPWKSRKSKEEGLIN